MLYKACSLKPFQMLMGNHFFQVIVWQFLQTALLLNCMSNLRVGNQPEHYLLWCWDMPAYILMTTLTLSQCTLAGPVYTGMPLECHWLTQCTLGYHWATQRILAGYTGTPLEKLNWNSPHWNATGETLTFAAYIGTPLEGLWQPTQAPTHIVKHAE